MSKLSLHISDWLNPEITFDFVERTRPPVIKVFGDVALDDHKLQELKRRSPATVVIGRVYFPEQRIERDETTPLDTVFNYDPIADARHAFEYMRPMIEKMGPLVDVWEGYNEIPIDTSAPLTERERQKARNYSAFTVEMARLMHQAGKKYAAYSFSTGNPVHLELWDLLLPGLKASDYLALHEYIAPNEAWTSFDWSMCHRYREVYARLPADARKPILITECGADYLGQQGYKGKIPIPQYMAMLAEYDRGLMQDAHVVGATIFCYGINAPQWKTYDIGGDFTKLLIQHILTHPTPPLDLPVLTTPVPAPSAGAPTTPTTPPVPRPSVGAPPASGLLPLDKARWFTEEAVRKIEQGDPAGARVILLETVIPWFYATAAQHSANLKEAQAHTAARWFTEEAVRRIEANDGSAARQLLLENVIPWLLSPGPKALGILSVTVRKPRRKASGRARKRKKA